MKRLNLLMEKYNLKIHKVLSFIYRFRVLNYSQIYTLVFSDSEDSYCHYTLRLLCGKLGLLEKNGYYRADSCYFLTRKAMSYLKKNGIVSLNNDEISYLDEYYTASELKLNDNILSHQLALNQFVVDFRSKIDNTEFTYYDEIYISSIFDNIRPDGILRVGNICYFLEMDMNTERKSRLINKWENYRKFLTTGQAEELEFEIKVLFILGGNIADSNKRKCDLSEYILDNLEDKISNRFNIYIDNSKNLIDFIIRDIKGNIESLDKLLLWKGFKVTPANFVDAGLSGYSYSTYIYKPSKNGMIEVEGGVPIEFIVDYCYWGNILTLKNISYFDTFSGAYLSHNKRNINYLLVVNSVKDAFDLVKQINLKCSLDYIYFITMDRLKNYETFNEAIFKMDLDGSYYHFKKDNIKIRIDEGKIKKLR